MTGLAGRLTRAVVDPCGNAEFHLTQASNVDEGVYETTAVLDNGAFGTREVRFETGRLAK